MKMYLKKTHGALFVLALVLCGVAHAADATAPETAPLPLAPEPLPESAVPEAPRVPPTPPPPEKPIEPGVVRVPYVPEIVKQQIRDQVRAELRADVVQDVLTHAKEQRWGVPGVLPDWIERIKLKGDFRVRLQGEKYADGNVDNLLTLAYPDFPAINKAGGFTLKPELLLNTTEDRVRLRERLRLGLEAAATNEVKVIVQLSTGNTTDPVSTNQTLGNSGGRYGLVIDQAYLRWDGLNADRYPWLTWWAGRVANPYLSTDLVWDSDLAFEGLAATYRYNLAFSDDLLALSERDNTLFFTAGAFPIQEVALSSRDKWLYGAQLGAEFISTRQSRLKLALSYYNFVRIAGRRHSGLRVNSEFDHEAPDFMQKGNTLFDMYDEDPIADRFALASDYNLANFTLVYDIARFAPHHMVWTADYVRNLGYDRSEIARRTGGESNTTQFIDARTVGYQLQASFGWPLILERGTWRVSIAYKHLERDAVPDAFTDSDFHLGGTDAKGWIVGGEYAFADNTWLTVRYLTADAIDGPPLGIDILQIDVNAKF